SPRLLGSPSLAAAPGPADWHPLAAEEEQAWQALRQLPESAHLGLALPRFLLRLPYGREASSVEQFHFEELDGGAGHEAFLWGSPGLLCACLLGEAFSRRGWDIGRGLGQEVGGLPVCVYRADGESPALPCARPAPAGRGGGGRAGGPGGGGGGGCCAGRGAPRPACRGCSPWHSPRGPSRAAGPAGDFPPTRPATTRYVNTTRVILSPF